MEPRNLPRCPKLWPVWSGSFDFCGCWVSMSWIGNSSWPSFKLTVFHIECHSSWPSFKHLYELRIMLVMREPVIGRSCDYFGHLSILTLMYHISSSVSRFLMNIIYNIIDARGSSDVKIYWPMFARHAMVLMPSIGGTWLW